MTKKRIDLVATDFDGTIRSRERVITPKDMRTLEKLGHSDIPRVVATGRTLYSFRQATPDNFPIDYLVFSSGAGIMDWTTKKLLKTNELNQEEIAETASVFLQHDTNFMIFQPIPENHRFLYYCTGRESSDFTTRFERYTEFAEPFRPEKIPARACQFMSIVPDGLPGFERLRQAFSRLNLKVIRATSPLDGVSVWLEVFPPHVSKGEGVKWLCDRLGIDYSHTFGIGNDYNDLDLLGFTAHSFVVDNAPDELKKRFRTSESIENSGFSKALEQVWK